jgi:biotin carboxyl carrier protein
LTIHEVLVNKKPHRVTVLERNGSTFLGEVNEKSFTVKIKNPNQGGTFNVEINGRSLQAKIERIQRNILQVRIGGRSFEVQCYPEVPKEAAVMLKPVDAVVKRPIMSLAIEKDAVTAPIAGRIVLLKIEVGQKVSEGECICIVEAMKMENEITAPRKGVVKEVRISEGAIVNKRDVLAIIT